MIFSDVPDPRLVTIRRGGTLADADHLWGRETPQADQAARS